MPSFLETLSQVCDRHILAEKWLLAPSHRVGQQWKDRVNLSGTTTVNLHVHTWSSLVQDLLRDELTAEGVTLLDHQGLELVIGGTVGELLQAGALSYFSRAAGLASLSRLAVRTVTDLRMASITSADIERSQMMPVEKRQDMVRLLAALERRMEELSVVDNAGCLQRAVDALAAGRVALPASLVVIRPERMELTRCESDLLAQLESRCEVTVLEKDSRPPEQVSATFSWTQGEVNEVRQVLEDLLCRADSTAELRLDQVEVLYTDYATYVPLIHELLVERMDEDIDSPAQLPVAFGEGLACIYSRPGRALRSWLRWGRHDCLQSMLVQMIREGLLVRPSEQGPDNESGHSFVQLAHALRKLPIGFGRRRFVPQIVAAVADAAARIEAAEAGRMAGEVPETPADFDFGQEVLTVLLAMLRPVVELLPRPQDSARSMLLAATQFLQGHARCANEMDNMALARMLSQIESMLDSLDAYGAHDGTEESTGEKLAEGVGDVWTWLEQLPTEVHLLSGGPRPGCLFVDHITRGGHSGRSVTYVVGLDDSRQGDRLPQDPLLLDFDRASVSPELTTSATAADRLMEDLQQLLRRLAGRVHFSFAGYSLTRDHEQFPSSLLLAAYRHFTESPAATMEDFIEQLGQPISFCSDDDRRISVSDQWWQRQMDATPFLHRSDQLQQRFRHLAAGDAAAEAIAGNAFTQHDGCVPVAGRELDPTQPGARRLSASQLETFGACPRRYFFKYGLKIAPPQEYELVNERWLNPLTLGSLVHSVFEQSLIAITAEQRRPQPDDHTLVLDILHQQVAELRTQIPAPNEDAYQRQLRELEQTCATFIRREVEYCRDEDAHPWVFEASIGLGDDAHSPIDLAEPVPLQLENGKTILIGGRIDRIDRLGGTESLSFGIWDYKSGSAWGFDRGDPFKQGRKLQPLLYVGMLRHQLKTAIDGACDVGFFGYFFPSPREQGLRISWTSVELQQGQSILCDICEAIASGAFPATSDVHDCAYCDYQAICGSPQQAAAGGLLTLQLSEEPALDPIRRIRNVPFVRSSEGNHADQ